MSGIDCAAGIIDKGKPIGVDVSRGTSRFLIRIVPVQAYKFHLSDTASLTAVLPAQRKLAAPEFHSD